jgi:transcriptional regulator with XRE-family HTH domain
MPREIELRLEALMKERAPDTGRGELAESLGVSKALVRAYLENRWTVLDRTVLERLADFLQCDASLLLATSESSFFEPFRRLSGREASPGNPFCLYLCREDADKMAAGRALAYRDHRAISHVDTLLRNQIDRMTSREVSATTSEEFQKHLLQNCVVVASPMVNPAAEIAICHAFGVEPFSSAARAKLPFTFRTVDAAENPVSSLLEPSPDGKRGIWLREEKALIGYDYWPPAQFRQLRIKKGRDCAVIIVSNHRPEGLSGHSRKLVVLAGFGGAGTEAAANALVDQFRDLEPRESADVVWGVIEVFYRKAKDNTTRKELTYNWRCRVGGRCPIALVSRHSQEVSEIQNNGG